MVRTTTRLGMMLLVFIAFSVVTSAQEVQELRQWAARAEATSEYQSDSWSAAQATGAPDVRGCGDSVNAWASLNAGTREALTVYYDIPVYPTEINIHQNYMPGSIVSVDMITVDGDQFPIRGSEDTDTSCPHTFTISFGDEGDLPLVVGLVIHLDQSAVNDWSEIDAVELAGYPDPDAITVDTSTTTGNNGYTYDGPSGLTVTCDDGTVINNGVQVTVIQMRSGFNYTATAIGLNGFDPVLAVLDTSTMRGLCVDDSREAASYTAWLPTTGQVESSSRNSQIIFSNNSREPFADIALVVGGFNNASGEFVLILEGMARTAADGDGDPFSLKITPGMIASGVVPTAYMISVTRNFDPLMALFSPDSGYLQDSNKNPYACDDAGAANSCWGESYNLAGSYISRTYGRQLAGGNLDAMLMLPVQAGMENLSYYYMMSSTRGTTGDYIVAFHVGID